MKKDYLNEFFKLVYDIFIYVLIKSPKKMYNTLTDKSSNGKTGVEVMYEYNFLYLKGLFVLVLLFASIYHSYVYGVPEILKLDKSSSYESNKLFFIESLIMTLFGFIIPFAYIFYTRQSWKDFLCRKTVYILILLFFFFFVLCYLMELSGVNEILEHPNEILEFSLNKNVSKAEKFVSSISFGFSFTLVISIIISLFFMFIAPFFVRNGINESFNYSGSKLSYKQKILYFISECLMFGILGLFTVIYMKTNRSKWYQEVLKFHNETYNIKEVSEIVNESWVSIIFLSFVFILIHIFFQYAGLYNVFNSDYELKIHHYNKYKLNNKMNQLTRKFEPTIQC